MKYHENGDPADLEAAYRMIEKNGYGCALDPIKERIAELEEELGEAYHHLELAVDSGNARAAQAYYRGRAAQPAA